MPGFSPDLEPAPANVQGALRSRNSVPGSVQPVAMAEWPDRKTFSRFQRSIGRIPKHCSRHQSLNPRIHRPNLPIRSSDPVIVPPGTRIEIVGPPIVPQGSSDPAVGSSIALADLRIRPSGTRIRIVRPLDRVAGPSNRAVGSSIALAGPHHPAVRNLILAPGPRIRIVQPLDRADGSSIVHAEPPIVRVGSSNRARGWPFGVPSPQSGVGSVTLSTTSRSTAARDAVSFRPSCSRSASKNPALLSPPANRDVSTGR